MMSSFLRNIPGIGETHTAVRTTAEDAVRVGLSVCCCRCLRSRWRISHKFRKFFGVDLFIYILKDNYSTVYLKY